jgi:hypothetical protein
MAEPTMPAIDLLYLWNCRELDLCEHEGEKTGTGNK